jgi:30S ribosomal protein S31
MGKGDKRTRRGKIFAGSYGKTRPKKKASGGAAVSKDSPKKKGK